MSFYALQASYTPVAWTALVNAPANRLEAVRPAVERLGGRIVNGWFSFGEYDVLIVCEMPDAVSAAALSMAISSSGGVKAVKTTPLKCNWSRSTPVRIFGESVAGRFSVSMRGSAMCAQRATKALASRTIPVTRNQASGREETDGTAADDTGRRVSLLMVLPPIGHTLAQLTPACADARAIQHVSGRDAPR